MKLFLISILFVALQDPVTVIKNNGDELLLSDYRIYQSSSKASASSLSYSHHGQKKSIALNQIKRISLKESVRKKKGVATFRVIIVKSNNDKLEVEVDLVKIEGKNENGKLESTGFGSVDKISF
ncbi:MAG: hypothetical protein AAFY41_06150 [Bacteroidota bacterium]